MRHAILGAGAIGGLMAVTLVTIGEEVTLIVRPEKAAGYPTHLTLDQSTETLAADATIVGKLTAPVDVLWIATKSQQLETALASIQSSPGMVVPLLNGIDHLAVLRARFGSERVVAATIAVAADRVADGHFAQPSGVRLMVAGAGRSLLESVLNRLHERCGFSTGFVDNEETLLWTKLCFLGPFALATTASGMNKGEIFADPAWKSKLMGAVDETVAVAGASGAKIDAAKIHAGFDAFHGSVRSSMAKDFVAGRPLELDAIAGPIVHAGERHKIPTPVTRELAAMIRSKVENEQR